MKKLTVQIAAFAAVVAVALTSEAVDGIANNTTGSGWYWSASQYWFDKDGQSLGTYPHEAGDTAYILCNSNMLRTIQFSPKDSFARFALKSVGGGFMHELLFYAPTATGTAYPVQRLTIENPNGFPGFWGTYNGYGRDEIVLDGANGVEPHLSNYEITGRMGLNVPAGKSAAVGTLFGEGALYATGSGTLTVERTQGSEAILFATNGTVEVVGRAAVDDEDSPVAGAYAHFDASDETTLDTFTGEDGYKHVWRWRSAGSGGVFAVSNSVEKSGDTYLPCANTPYLCNAAVSPSGLSTVDFGDASNKENPTAPANCFLSLSDASKNVREVFFAGQIRESGAASFFGASGNDRTFMIGGVSSLVSSTAPDDSRFGDLRINGQKVTYNNVWPTRHGSSLLDFSVASISIADESEATGEIALLGSRAYLKAETGNVRIGELLVYTNKLTASQRLRVTQYLMKKWLKGFETEDFAAAALGTATSDAAISVPAGNTARIGSVTVRNGTLVKKGAGVLSVGQLAPSNAAIAVQGGSVRLRSPSAVETSAPASNPYFWLDAEVQDSVVTQKLSYAHLDPNVYYVTRWNDCRGAGYDVYAEVPQTSLYANYPTNFPTVVESVANGHRAVDFGMNKTGGKASFMRLQPNGAANAYEGFIAFKFNRENSNNNIFGSTGTDLYRANASQLLNITHSAPSVNAGLWHWDGEIYDPWQSYDCFGDTDFHVVSFSGASKVKADLLAKDRLTVANFPGDQSIGEFILYDRRLTPEERRATTAYLMKKWLNRELPGSAAAAASVSDHPVAFADDTAVVIDATDDIEGLKVSGGNGSIVKKGTGTVSLDSFTTLNAVESIVVEEGDLAVPIPTGIDDKDALFHFDAMDTDGMTFVLEEDDGGVVSNVTHWLDVRRKDGIFAHSSVSASEYITDNVNPLPAGCKPATVDPTLMTVQMPDGSFKPTVDFGKLIVTSTGTGGAGMQFNKAFEDVMEIHTIFADNTINRGGTIVGGRNGAKATSYGFMRANSGAGGQLLNNSAHTDVKNGYIAVNGEEKDGSYALDLNFHLISYAPLSAQMAATFAHERGQRCGGARISEQIAFSSALPAEKRAYLENYMMWKWGISDERPIDVSFTSLAVASDTRLDLGKVYVAATALSGAGTIAADMISGVSTITILGMAEKLSVKGSVALANGTLTLAFADDLSKLPAGEYVIFEADDIDASGLTGFQFLGTLPRNKTVGARIAGNRILLKVEKHGLVIMVR